MMKYVPAIYLILCGTLMLTFVFLHNANASRAHFTQDNFVRLIEAREGIVPGQARVIPDCSCTVRYVGTQVSGNRYKVVFDKLD